MVKARTNLALDLTLCLIALFWFTALNGAIPGLHLDEAWVILRSNSIVSGERPINGMNDYTGALQGYLFAPWGLWFGFKTGTFRDFTAAFSIGVLFTLLRGLRYLGLSNIMLIGGALLFISHPVTYAFSRTGFEVTSLNFFLGMASLYLLLTAEGRKHRIALAGVLVGLSVWTHFFYIVFPIALGLTWILTRKWKLRIFALFSVGFLLGVMPRIVDFVFKENSSEVSGKGMSSLFDQGVSFLGDLPNLPGVLRRMFEGDLIFQRYAGVEAGGAFPLVAVIFGGVLFIRAYRSLKEKEGFFSFEKSLWIFTLILTTSVAFIVPRWSDRYFQLTTTLLTILLIFSIACFERSRSRLLKRGAPVLLLGLSSYFFFFTYQNFTKPFLENGGGISRFKVGARLEETSSHYLNSQPVFESLRRLGVREVYTEGFIEFPFHVFSHYSGDAIAIHGFSAEDALPEIPRKTAFLFYGDTLDDIGSRTFKEKLERKAASAPVIEVDVGKNFRVWVVGEGST